MEGWDSVGVELLVQCSSCGAQQPVNQPVPSVRCTNCLGDFEVDRSVWAAVLGDCSGLFARLGRGVLEAGKLDRAGRDAEWERGPDAPPCEACGERTAFSAEGLACRACGQARASQPAPAHLTDVDAQIAGVVATPDTKHETPKKMAMACVGCGAALSLDETASRQLPCTYCETTNVISDDIWRALHPPRQRRRFWIMYRLSDDPRRAPPTPIPAAGGLTLVAMFPLFFVSMCGGGGIGTAVNWPEEQDLVDILPYWAVTFTVLSLGFWLWVRRKEAPELAAQKLENEVIGRITSHDGAAAMVALVEPGTGRELGEGKLFIKSEELAKLGGVGGQVRAYLDRKSGKSMVFPIASVLA